MFFVLVALIASWQDVAVRSFWAADASEPAPTMSADEQAIRKSASDYEAACNAKDAKAIAELFTPSGEIVESDGSIVHGREAIAGAFADIFAANPKAKTKVSILSIRSVAPGVAIEDGTTTTVPAPRQPAVISRYCVTHVKHDGRWLMASARDLETNDGSIPISERLKPLEFLIGDWVDESPASLVSSSYRWADGKRFIDQKFSATINGSTTMTGTQRIGWDPLTKSIKSWIFDSNGGHATGTWSWDGKRWIVKVTGVSADGSLTSATSAFTPRTKDAFDYESILRVIDGRPASDLFAHVVRRPPQPKTRAVSESH